MAGVPSGPSGSSDTPSQVGVMDAQQKSDKLQASQVVPKAPKERRARGSERQGPHVVRAPRTPHRQVRLSGPLVPCLHRKDKADGGASGCSKRRHKGKETTGADTVTVTFQTDLVSGGTLPNERVITSAQVRQADPPRDQQKRTTKAWSRH